MSLNYVRLGKRIRQTRKRRDISQQTLAEHINLSPGFVSNVECGKKKPGLETLVDIANALGVTLDMLLVDSLINSHSPIGDQFAELLGNCTEFEKEVLIENAHALKRILKENLHLIGRRR